MDFYKLCCEGIVYLIDPKTAAAYTYDLNAPLKIGQLIWENQTTQPSVKLDADWQQKLAIRRQTYEAAVHASSLSF